MKSPVALVGMAGGTGRAVTLLGIIPPWCIAPPAVHYPTAPDPGTSLHTLHKKAAAHRCDKCVWLQQPAVQAEGKRGTAEKGVGYLSILRHPG